MMGEKWNRGVYQYKIEFNTHWMLIFQHNTSKGFFKNENDAKLSLVKGKFSILDRISNNYFVHRFSTDYEFLLEYPIEYEGQYNRWKQTKDPLDDPDYNSTVPLKATGFDSINCSWTYLFGGLMKSHSGRTLLDGQTGSWYWNYAIGDYTSIFKPNTAGTPTIDGKDTIPVSFVNLWIRISSPFLPNYTCGNRNPINNLIFTAITFLSTFKNDE